MCEGVGAVVGKETGLMTASCRRDGMAGDEVMLGRGEVSCGEFPSLVLLPPPPMIPDEMHSMPRDLQKLPNLNISVVVSQTNTTTKHAFQKAVKKEQKK